VTDPPHRSSGVLNRLSTTIDAETKTPVVSPLRPFLSSSFFIPDNVENIIDPGTKDLMNLAGSGKHAPPPTIPPQFRRITTPTVLKDNVRSISTAYTRTGNRQTPVGSRLARKWCKRRVGYNENSTTTVDLSPSVHLGLDTHCFLEVIAFSIRS